MACYKPLYGTRRKDGKLSVRRDPWYYQFRETMLVVSCGQCTGCRLERSRQWAVRITHEAQMHEANSFLTLTYDDAHLPPDLSLRIRDFQLFMKRLRKWRANEDKVANKEPYRLRFFHCGEYGDLRSRPHYHACLFGEDFSSDRKHFKGSAENKLYTSKLLDTLWGHGYAVIGNLTFDSAAYVARYCMKKITGPKSVEHYNGRKPEYTSMSRRPGIGKPWLDKYKSDVYPDDFVISKGNKAQPPKYYDGQYQLENPTVMAEIKKRREERNADDPNNHPDRLLVRETVAKARLNQSNRNQD